ncbi:MAG: conjugal transfer protein TraX [Defluviitaleaceae bacterium]|nr:conjugal transfer protein TraX [Defluviitaleaceae bacterium]
MTAFTLKIIAVIAMVLDHIAVVFPRLFDGVIYFRVIGRLAFPIFVYLIAEGFRHTKSPVKYLLRLGAFAVISEVFFDWAFNDELNFFMDTNVFYTLFLGGLAIAAYREICGNARPLTKSRRGKSAGLRLPSYGNLAAFLPLLVLMCIAELVSSDYGANGVILIFLMYVVPLKWRFLTMAAVFIWDYAAIAARVYQGKSSIKPELLIMYVLATLVGVALVYFYNGKRGRSLKWAFYVAYPLHLGVLAVAAILFSASDAETKSAEDFNVREVWQESFATEARQESFEPEARQESFAPKAWQKSFAPILNALAEIGQNGYDAYDRKLLLDTNVIRRYGWFAIDSPPTHYAFLDINGDEIPELFILADCFNDRFCDHFIDIFTLKNGVPEVTVQPEIHYFLGLYKDIDGDYVINERVARMGEFDNYFFKIDENGETVMIARLYANVHAPDTVAEHGDWGDGSYVYFTHEINGVEVEITEEEHDLLLAGYLAESVEIEWVELGVE